MKDNLTFKTIFIYVLSSGLLYLLSLIFLIKNINYSSSTLLLLDQSFNNLSNINFSPDNFEICSKGGIVDRSLRDKLKVSKTIEVRCDIGRNKRRLKIKLLSLNYELISSETKKVKDLKKVVNVEIRKYYLFKLNKLIEMMQKELSNTKRQLLSKSITDKISSLYLAKNYIELNNFVYEKSSFDSPSRNYFFQYVVLFLIFSFILMFFIFSFFYKLKLLGAKHD